MGSPPTAPTGCRRPAILPRSKQHAAALRRRLPGEYVCRCGVFCRGTLAQRLAVEVRARDLKSFYCWRVPAIEASIRLFGVIDSHSRRTVVPATEGRQGHPTNQIEAGSNHLPSLFLPIVVVASNQKAIPRDRNLFEAIWRRQAWWYVEDEAQVETAKIYGIPDVPHGHDLSREVAAGPALVFSGPDNLLFAPLKRRAFTRWPPTAEQGKAERDATGTGKSTCSTTPQNADDADDPISLDQLISLHSSPPL